MDNILIEQISPYNSQANKIAYYNIITIFRV